MPGPSVFPSGEPGVSVGWPWEAQSSPRVRGKAGGCARVTAHLAAARGRLWLGGAGGVTPWTQDPGFPSVLLPGREG